MHIIPGKTPLSVAAFVLVMVFCSPSFAEKYYRWTGPDGVVHYGSRPPQGVKAELISTFGKSAGKSAPSAGNSSTNADTDKAYSEKQKEIVAKRAKQCEQEKQRLNTLKNANSRIQMEQADGTSRYLSAEEVMREIESSESYLAQACQ